MSKAVIHYLTPATLHPSPVTSQGVDRTAGLLTWGDYITSGEERKSLLIIRFYARSKARCTSVQRTRIMLCSR
jgi:hypothetical protein